jgi:hypothetical protein
MRRAIGDGDRPALRLVGSQTWLSRQDPSRPRALGYGVFSGLVLAPSPPPVPAASALLGLVSLPGAP